MVHTTPPHIAILSHDTSRAINVLGQSKKVIIKGQVIDDRGIAQIQVNDKDVVFDRSGNVETDVYLGLGKNEIMVSAVDPSKNTAVKTIMIIRKAPAAHPPQKKY
jgi:hypothetical protein